MAEVAHPLLVDETAKTNGQLPTPALSPVLENGPSSSEIAEFPLNDNESSKENHAPEEEVRAEAAEVAGASKKGMSNDSMRKRSITNIASPPLGQSERDKVLKLSPTQITALTSSPTSLPIRAASPLPDDIPPLNRTVDGVDGEKPPKSKTISAPSTRESQANRQEDARTKVNGVPFTDEVRKPPKTAQFPQLDAPISITAGKISDSLRPKTLSRTVSSPPQMRRRRATSGKQGSSEEGNTQRRVSKPVPPPLRLDSQLDQSSAKSSVKPSPGVQGILPSPMPQALPLPPMSVHTYLQLELSAARPSQLYIHRSSSADLAYESSEIKFERIKNFLILLPKLEQLLGFGALTCLDVWLHTFTILPMRFLTAISILVQWWFYMMVKEATDIGSYIYEGLGRVWRRRRRQSSVSSESSTQADGKASMTPNGPPTAMTEPARINADARHLFSEQQRRSARSSRFMHRRTKSVPSALQAEHKADLLKGLLLIASCMILMRFDASRMYHHIRGQAVIKLYVIYNVLEVGAHLDHIRLSTLIVCRFSIDCCLPSVKTSSSASARGRHSTAMTMAVAESSVLSSCSYSPLSTTSPTPRHCSIKSSR